MAVTLLHADLCPSFTIKAFGAAGQGAGHSAVRAGLFLDLITSSLREFVTLCG